MKKRKILVSLLAVVMTAAVAMFAFSCKKQSETPKDYGEAGLYYCEAVNGDEYALSLAGSKIAMTTTEETVAGTYSYDGKTFKVTFAGESASEGKLEDNVLTITYKGSTYTFYKNVKYTASFSVDGIVKETAKVTNGKKLVKPADPQKADNNFVGWYSNAEYTAPYDFNLPVLGDVTLYARFAPAKPGESEFNAKLMADDKVYENVKTIGGVIYHLPVLEAKAGKEFSGWYVSDYQSAEKLTYKYDGRKLAADTTLYAVWKSAAPEVTISESGKVVWTVKGGVTGYAVKVYQGKNEEPVHTQNDVSGEVSYNFANAEAGDYKITVSDGSNETAVYYKNKVLARVSQFEVVEPGVLVWNEVAGADKYLVTVNCGTEGHTHKDFDNGKSTNYNFANCDMKQGGITFEVKAVAAGRATSVSEAFVYNRELEKVTGLQIKNDVAYWNKVAGAASYVVTVKKVGEDEVTENVGNSTSYSLKNYTGSVSVSVVPVTKGYNSPEAASAVYTKTTLSAPAGVKVVGNKIVWEEVADAKGYVVKIGSAVKNITGGSVTECEITDADVENVSEIKVTVQALANNTANNSAESDEVVAAVGKMSSAPVYAAGVVSWGAVLGASKYEVTVNNGKINAITDGSTTFNANLDKAGNNEIVVKAFKDGAKEGEYVYVCEGKVTVKAYMVTIDVRGGTDVEKQYVAYGDELTIPSTKYYGYDFKGWYNLPGGAADNGKLFENGATYDYASNMILYAYWEPAVVDVIFDTMGVGSMNADDLEENEIGQLVYKVTFGKSYKLPVPDKNTVISSTTFGGWYTEPNGLGDKYTNELGSSGDNIWDDAQTITLFATWRETLTYTKVYDQDTGGTGYSVTKGPDIEKVETVEIPKEYIDGLPITTVEMDAFKNCRNLIEVRIPDSIQNIETGYVTSEGVEISAFSGCTKLEKVNVYEVEGNHDKLWSSRGGVLFYNNVIGNNGVEMRYVPAALKPSAEEGAILTEYKDESGVTCTQFKVPADVTTLPLNAFASATFTRIVVPYNVVKIDAKAFSNSKAKEIIFEETPAGVTEQELVIFNENAFKGCAAETIILPARLHEINFPAVFGSGSCSKLKSIGFVGEGGRYTVASLNEAMNVTLSDGTVVACGLVVDNSVASAKKVVLCPAKYAIDDKNANNNVITVPDNIAEIGEKAFYKTEFAGVVISASVTKIGSEAFEECSKLAKLTINQAETDNEPLEIEDKAFYNCPLLASSGKENYLVFPARTAIIGQEAFSGKTSAKYNKAVVKVVFEGDTNGSLRINDKAFANCSNLTNVAFGASLKYIGLAAFNGTKVATVELDCGDDVDISTAAFFSSTSASSAASSKITTLIIGANVGYIDLGAAFGSKINNIRIDKANRNYSIPGGKESYLVKESVTGADGGVTETEKIVSVLPEGVTPIKTFVNNGIVYNGDVTKLVYYPACETRTTYKTPDTVTSIAPYACVGGGGMAKVTSFTVGKNVTEIGASAFAYNYIQTPKMTFTFEPDDSAEAKTLTIGEYAFAWFTVCANLTIPGRAKVISEYAFANSNKNNASFQNITIEEGVEEIKANAFSGCSKLVSVSLPASLKVIEGELKTFAFEGCSAMQTITVADGSDYYAVKDNVLYSKTGGKNDAVVFVPKNAKGAISISNTITSIAAEAFNGLTGVTSITFDGALVNNFAIADKTFMRCSNLATVTLVDGITSIGKQAFYNCSKLTSVVIPKTVNFIGSQAFYNTKLATVTFEADESVADELLTFEDDSSATSDSSSFGIFYNSSIAELNLPNRPLYIGAGAFYKMQSLLKVTLNSTDVRKIGVAAFAYCTELTEIVGLGDLTLDEIANYAFSRDAKLVIDLPQGIELIGMSALRGIANESIVIPASVKTVEWCAFQEAKLKSVAFEENSVCEFIGGSAFNGCSELKTITLPESLKTIDGGNTFGSTQIERIAIPASVEEIKSRVFGGAAMLSSITFAENSKLKTLGDNAFGGTAITSFVFPETASIIDIPQTAQLFNGCTNLEELTISSSVPDITASIAGLQTLKHIYVNDGNKNYSTNDEHTMLLNSNKTAIKYICGILEEETVNITEGIKTIGASVFAGQWKVKKFVIPASVKTIESKAFDGCISVSSIEFEKNGLLTDIGANAFNGCKKLTRLTLPGSLRKLSAGVFGGSYIQEVYVPDSVVSLEEKAFANATYLSKVTGLQGITVIPANAFNGSGITTIEIGENCTKIANNAFDGCKKLVSVTGMKNVETIGTNAFKYCSALAEFTLSEKIKSIADYTFAYCSSLSKVNGLENVQSVGDSAFYHCTSLVEADLPNVTTIGSSAFNGSGLVTVSIPNVAKLNISTFNECASLANVTLSDELTDIGRKTFFGCTSLKQIKLPEKLNTLNQWSFMGSGLVSIEIPAGVTRIEEPYSPNASTVDGVFRDCAALESVTINGDLESIGDYAFYGCEKLSSFDFSKVDAVGAYAFAYSGLESVDLTGVNTIGTSSFANSLRLKELTGVTVIANKAFENCGFETLDLSTVTSLGSSAFSGNKQLETLTIGGNMSAVGEKAFEKCSALNKVVIKDGVVSIGVRAFNGCSAISDLTLPASLATINSEAFYGCSALTAVDLPESLATVENSAFKNCSLTSVTVSKALTSIGSLAFDCATLTEYIGGNESYTVVDGVLYSNEKVYAYPAAKMLESAGEVTVASLNEYAFYNNKNIKKVVLQSGITEIPTYAFAYSSIEEIVIPSSVETIASYAFRGSSSLKTVTFATAENDASKLKNIEGSAFYGCSALGKIDLPESLASVGDYAFAESGLTEATLPEACSTIGRYLFYNCANLVKVNILSSGIVSLPERMFSGCSALEGFNAPSDDNLYINIPEQINKFADSVFESSGIKKVVLPSGYTSVTGSMGFVFRYCEQLTEVTFNGAVTEIGTYMFTGCTNLSKLSFKGGSVASDGTVVFPSTLKTIGNGAFAHTGLVGVQLPAGLTELGNMTLTNVTNLDVAVNDVINGSNPVGAFQGCSALKKVVINSTGLTKGYAAFVDCANLETVEFGSAVKTVSNKIMFGACPKLSSIVFGGLTTTADGMFIGSTGLKTLVLPKTLTTLGSYTFADSGLTSVSYATGYTAQFNLGRGSFKGCADLTTVTLPSIKKITTAVDFTYAEWFMDCSALESVTFGNTVNILGAQAFAGCGNLKTVKFGSSSENGIYIPEGILIGKNAFDGVGEGATITFETNYYYTIGVWDANWASGCKATIVMDNVIMNPYLF